jgi:hypothetical protein
MEARPPNLKYWICFIGSAEVGLPSPSPYKSDSLLLSPSIPLLGCLQRCAVKGAVL